jgi:hypothetical protein
MSDEPKGSSAPAAPEVWRPGPRTTGPLTQGDLIFTALMVIALLGSVLMTPSSEALSVFGYELPPLCLWRATTGWRCPGCGMTRAFTYMGHLQPVEAFRVHVLGPFLWLAVAYYTPIRLYRTWKAWRQLRAERGAGR